MTTGLTQTGRDRGISSQPRDSGAYILAGPQRQSGEGTAPSAPGYRPMRYVDNASMEVGNAFGGAIYLAIEPGSTLESGHNLNVVEAPHTFTARQTSGTGQNPAVFRLLLGRR